MTEILKSDTFNYKSTYLHILYVNTYRQEESIYINEKIRLNNAGREK
ncbi:hypothetical protein CLOSBL3_10967 [Clostridiaceae bacterium BL-3]|nr:hypothetical protein CLOSBL3_10967 [Clostridiaceae bacterium BL-3]